MADTDSMDRAREVADAVLYEGKKSKINNSRL